MEDTPTQVQDLAAACARSVESSVGVPLDGTQDTLPLLDHYARESLNADDEELDLTSAMCGAYFGQVVRRHLGDFRWSLDESHARWRLELGLSFLFFNPVGIAREVITGKEQPGWWGHYEVRRADRKDVEEALGVYGVEREEAYYTFGVRFEVVEQVVHALGRKAIQGKEEGDELPTIESEAYAEHVRIVLEGN